MEVTATLYARPETGFWDADLLDRYGIAEAFGLYLIPHDGESTVDVTADLLENVFMFWTGTPDHLRDAAHEALAYESCGRDYLMRADLNGADARLTALVSVELDEDEDAGMALHEAVSTGGADEPAILSESVWRDWHAERIAKRRARNLPPIANFGANGLDNLPLFVHAANALLRPTQPVAARIRRLYGDCAAYRWQKSKLEAECWTWAL